MEAISADDIFFNKNGRISIKISLKFVSWALYY